MAAMAEKRTKRKRDEDLPRVTYNAGPRTFDRLLKEGSLEEMKNVVRKKLGHSSDMPLQLAQLRDGKPVDLEDDDDFEAFCSAAHTLPHIVVQVTLSSKPHLEGSGASCQPSPSAHNLPVPETPKRRKKKRKLEIAEGAADDAAHSSPKKRKNPSNEERDTQTAEPAAPEEQVEQRPKKKAKKSKAKEVVEAVEQDVTASKEASQQQSVPQSIPTNAHNDAASSKPEEPKKKRQKKKGVGAVDGPPPKDADAVEPVVVQTKTTVVVGEEPSPSDAEVEKPAEKPKKKKKRSDKAQVEETPKEPEANPEVEEATRLQAEEEPFPEMTPAPVEKSGSKPSKDIVTTDGKVEKKKKNKKKDAASDLAEALTRAAALNEQQDTAQDPPESEKTDHPAQKDKDEDSVSKAKPKQKNSKQSKDANVDPQDRETLDAVFAAVLNRKKPSVDQQPPAEKPSVAASESKAEKPKRKKMTAQCPICLAVDAGGRAHTRSRCPLIRSVHYQGLCTRLDVLEKDSSPDEDGSRTELIQEIRGYIIKKGGESALTKGQNESTAPVPQLLAPPVPPAPSRKPTKKTPAAAHKTAADVERQSSATSSDSPVIPQARPSIRPPPPAQDSISVALSSAQSKTKAPLSVKPKATANKNADRDTARSSGKTDSVTFPISSTSLSQVTTSNLNDQLEALVRGPSAIRVNQIPSSDSEESEEEQLLAPEEEEEEEKTRHSKRFSIGLRGGDSSDEEQSENSDDDGSSRAATAPPVISISKPIKPASPSAGSDSEKSEGVDSKAGERSFHEVNQESSSLDIQPVGDRAFSEALAQDTQVFRLSAVKIPRPSDSESSEDEDQSKRNAAATPQDSEDERNADPDAGEDADEDMPAPKGADRTPQDSEDERNADPDADEDEDVPSPKAAGVTPMDSEDERNADPDAGEEEYEPSPKAAGATLEDSEDERNADPEAGEDEDGPAPSIAKATLEDSEDERDADPDADEPAANDDANAETAVANEPRPATPRRPTRRVRQESIEQFDTPNGPSSPVAVFGKSAVHSTPRMVDKMKDRTGKTPQPSPSRPLSSMDKAMKLLESVKLAKLPTSSQKPAAAAPKTPAPRTRASARLASQPPPDKTEVVKPPSKATRGRKAATQVVTEEPPKASGRATRGRKVAASQPTETLEYTPPPKRAKRGTTQLDEGPVEEDARESLNGHEEMDEVMQPMSMDNWEVLEEERSVAPEQPMVDELESDGPDATYTDSQKPLFLETETPHGFPYSQWADAANPRQAASDSDNESDEEEEVARAMMTRPKAPPRASQSFRRLTDIASQDIPQFHSAVRPARPSNDKSKTSERDLFGRSDESESSDSGSSDSDNDKKKRSHIPQSRRAGKTKA
ncbi:hypothetical protein BKA70DRAFT_1261041 [Coprinopsis sp. MPI-PUGE-AT-0042]|nr:hypothetical protein BKA70DRAFT_1261041 [Coprinopsis sp. MPI-PUGE-AT-0042]